MKKNVLIFSLLFAFIDQVIKYFVINYLELYKSIKVIPNFFYLTYTQNDGAAFSILSGGRWFFVVMGVVALFNPFGSSTVLMMFVGIVLMVEGLSDLISIIRISSFIKNLRG